MLHNNVNQTLVYKEDQGKVMTFHLGNRLRTSQNTMVYIQVHDGVMPFYNFSKS